MTYSSSDTIKAMCPIDFVDNDRIDDSDIADIQEYANDLINGYLGIEDDNPSPNQIETSVETAMCVRVIYRILRGTEKLNESNWKSVVEFLPREKAMLDRVRLKTTIGDNITGGFSYDRY